MTWKCDKCGKEFKTQQEADDYSNGKLLIEREHEELNGKIKL